MDVKKNEAKTIDDYIKTFPQNVQEKLEEIRKTIKKEVPQAEETISYKMPTFKLNGKYLVYFAGWKNHVSLYPFPSSLEKEVAEYKISGRGTIQFPLNKSLPIPLIKKIVKVLAENNLIYDENKRGLV